MAYKRVIAVDYDGTITKDGGDYPNVGDVKEGAIECLKEMQKNYKIALWTCRDGRALQEALEYLESLRIQESKMIGNPPLSTQLKLERKEQKLFVSLKNRRPNNESS